MANIKFNRLRKRQRKNNVISSVLSHAGYSPGRHLPLTLYLAATCLNSPRRSSKQPRTAARLEWDGRQLGHTVLLSLYTCFTSTIGAICARLVSFVDSAQLCSFILITGPSCYRTEQGYLVFNWTQLASCIIVRSYLLAQTSTECKLRDQSIRQHFPTNLKERICLFCPSQDSFPNCVIKPNNTSCCCSLNEDSPCFQLIQGWAHIRAGRLEA